ncbi:DUF2267 domain-containing protein [Ochrobactrum vermis]|uniref:DUF2267 domain-containing protein n=1 Tax=Ochrobactrum vermis TaxID=1827297 RepID=A0ABU8PJH8_9HYPH|nr:hypothetical protein [Ochrobactrum vermis]PQZ25947.1 hypothetical protein CQZ93_18260 [Ochrobactrum vermis]
MSVQSLIDSIATKINIEPQLAEKLAGSVFSVLQHSAPEIGNKIFALLPDAQQLANAHDVLASSTGGIMGALSGLMDNVAGEKMSAVLKAAATLRSNGLSSDQITEAGGQVINYVRGHDPQLVEQLVTNVPALKGHFGL